MLLFLLATAADSLAQPADFHQAVTRIEHRGIWTCALQVTDSSEPLANIAVWIT